MPKVSHELVPSPPIWSLPSVRHLPRFSLCLLFSLTVLPCAQISLGLDQAPVPVSGQVIDAETGAPLPAANIQIEGTFSGTISNAEGQFSLEIASFPVTLLVRYIGYEALDLPLPERPTEPLQLALTPVAIEMDEVTVSSEDPAPDVMRQVIERKQAWRATLESFQADSYNRFTLSNDTGIVSVAESLSEAFWKRGEGMREVVLAQRQTANLDLDGVLPAAQTVTNLYDDDIELSGYRLVGVTHPDALRHYRFTLAGVRSLDGTLVFDIDVRPRNRLKSAFEGRVSVLDGAFALLEVSLTPSEAFLFPPPVRAFDVTYSQQFSNYGQDYWLPVDFRADVAVEIAFGGLLTFPVFNIDQTARLTDYVVNSPLPDSLFATDQTVVMDSAAVEADTLLERSGVVVPLTARETVAYATLDSTMTLEDAFAPGGPLGRAVRSRMESDGDGATIRIGDGGDGPSRVNLEPLVWYNRVEGLHVGLTATGEIGERFSWDAMGAHFVQQRLGDDLDRDWAYGLSGTARVLDGRTPLDLTLSYTDVVATGYASAFYPRLITSAYLLLGGDDVFDYYASRLGRAEVTLTTPNVGTFTLGVQEESVDPAGPAVVLYDLAGRSKPQLPNPPPDRALLSTVTASWSVGSLSQGLGFFGANGFNLSLERSLGGPIFGVETERDQPSFTRLSLTAATRVPTFFRRRLLPNTLDLRLDAATYAGDLPGVRTGAVESGLSAYRPFGTLRSRTGRPYEAAQHVAGFWEHNFRTVPFELVGLRGLAQRGYSLILHGGHARIEAPAAPVNGPVAPERWIHEVGVGLSGLFGLLRVDVTTRLDAPAVTVGVGAARLF